MIGAISFVLVALSSTVWGAAVATDVCPQIPKGTKYQFQFPVDNACFRVVADQRRQYWTAKDACENDGGRLAEISSMKLQQYLFAYLKAKRYRTTVWIGLARTVKGTTKFSWPDGSPVGYRLWASGQGSEKKEVTCVTLNGGRGGRWYDTSCSSSAPGFVCEYGPHIQPTTTAAIPTTTTTTIPTTTTTTAAAPAPEPTTPPPPPPPAPKKKKTAVCIFSCPPDLDCGFFGYKRDPKTNCQICECNSYE